ncbi:MAG: hypothetical protein ABWK00_00480 [Desulfurococcaceae archaeon]
MCRVRRSSLLALLLALALAPLARAQGVAAAPSLPITIDGDPSDWGAFACPQNLTWYYVNVNGFNQWIWCDPEGDERTDFTGLDSKVPDPRVDLFQFRLTADENFLYGLVTVKSMDFIYLGENGATFVAITFNVNGAGYEVYFAGMSDTNVSSNAKWLYQLVINLADSRFTGQGKTQTTWPLNESNWGAIWYLVNSSWSFVTDPSGTAQMGVNTAKNAIEFRIPWTLIGGPPKDTSFFLRIELITARGWSNYAKDGGGTWDIGGSDALDAMTDVSGNTWYEVSDGVVDYYADVYFNTSPPYQPIPEAPLVAAVVAAVAIPLALFLNRRRAR